MRTTSKTTGELAEGSFGWKELAHLTVVHPLAQRNLSDQTLILPVHIVINHLKVQLMPFHDGYEKRNSPSISFF
jgi:hypothetical protein